MKDGVIPFILTEVKIDDHDNDPEEWYNLAKDKKYEKIRIKMTSYIPKNPAALKLTSTKLQAHHYPPFRSPDDYQDWVDNGRSNEYIINKWNKEVDSTIRN